LPSKTSELYTPLHDSPHNPEARHRCALLVHGGAGL
jgi:hypothetical protein